MHAHSGRSAQRDELVSRIAAQAGAWGPRRGVPVTSSWARCAVHAGVMYIEPLMAARQAEPKKRLPQMDALRIFEKGQAIAPGMVVREYRWSTLEHPGAPCSTVEHPGAPIENALSARAGYGLPRVVWARRPVPCRRPYRSASAGMNGAALRPGAVARRY